MKNNKTNMSFIDWVRDKIRSYMRDYPHLNKLTGENEHSDSQIDDAIFDVLEDYNTCTPVLRPIDLEKFPSLELLKLGAIWKLLTSASILFYRNELPYNDGDVSINDDSKGNPYEQLAMRFRMLYTEKRDEIKYHINFSQGMGQFSSPYTLYGQYLKFNDY